MPIIKRAIKKLRRDREVTARRQPLKKSLRTQVKLTRKNPSQKELDRSYSTLDKAAKIGIIHKRKAARLKSRLSKSLQAK